MKKNNTTIKFNKTSKTVIITRKNVSKTNKLDTRYVNLTLGKSAIINIHLKKHNWNLVVNFIQYKTRQDKEKNRPHFSINKKVKTLTKLGLRAKTAVNEFYRFRLDNVKTKRDDISKPRIPNQLTTASICSGIGASEESLKLLGFNPKNHKNLFMCEWDENVSDIYKDNFESENYFKDFYEVDWEKVENTHIHVLFISTPCQEFSLANSNRKGLSSEKGQLYVDALIKARELSPDKIINENVASIISSGKHYSKIQKEDGSIEELNYIPNEKVLKKNNWKLLKSKKNKYVYKSKFNPKLEIGRTIKIAEDMLTRDFKDYNIYMDVINTKDMGTTPQNRKRFFLVMIKKELDFGFKFPEKKPLNTTLLNLLDKKVDESLIINDRKIEIYPKVKNEDPKQLSLYGEVYNKNGTKSTYRCSKVIINPHISPCLTTKGHTKIFDPRIKKIRKLSSFEQKRVHGFSEEFKLPTNNYDLYSHVMGNTISPSVMKELIKNILFMEQIPYIPNLNVIPTMSNNTTYNTQIKKVA